MILGRKYDQEFLKELFFNDRPIKGLTTFGERYLLFEKLEEFIINSPSTVQIENKTNIVEAYRIALNLPRFDFPYWEIHFYKNGFYDWKASGAMGPGGQKLMVPNDDDEQDHFYFTFKSLAKEFRTQRGLHRSIDESFDFCKIDHFYTGSVKDQNDYGINLFIFDDTIDRYGEIIDWKVADLFDDDDTSSLSPLKQSTLFAFKKCFQDGSGIIDLKLKDLPQVMYLSEGSTFNYKTKNPENVIVMQDMFSSITAPNLTGSVYLHNSSILFQGFKDSHCGKNIVIGRDSEISSSYIGDNVLIGNRVIADRHSEIHDDVFIENGVRINEYQEIPAGQSLTANPPELMRLFKANRYELDQFERRTTNPY